MGSSLAVSLRLPSICAIVTEVCLLLIVPTRYGRAVAQVSAYFDSTGGL